jgi:hypothetical protein
MALNVSPYQSEPATTSAMATTITSLARKLSSCVRASDIALTCTWYRTSLHSTARAAARYAVSADAGSPMFCLMAARTAVVWLGEPPRPANIKSAEAAYASAARRAGCLWALVRAKQMFGP